MKEQRIRVFSEHSWRCAMHDDNLAEIWRSAQRRRADDIYSWFTHFFQRQRRLKSSEPSGFNIPNVEPLH
jgi:hypothetical protein